MRRFLITDDSPDLVATARSYTSIEEVTVLYLQGAGFLENKEEGGDGKALSSTAEWLGEEPSGGVDTSDEEVERVADLVKEIVSIEDTLAQGFQDAQREREAAEKMVSRFRDSKVEQLVEGVFRGRDNECCRFGAVRTAGDGSSLSGVAARCARFAYGRRRTGRRASSLPP